MAASTIPVENGSIELTSTESDPSKVQNSSCESEPTPLTGAVAREKWPGWPGDCVFRLIVPVLKVGCIIGRKGDLIKKMCEETRARIRVLEGPLSTPDRIVLISGKEEPEAPLSPAMDAVLRVFKRVSGLPESKSDAEAPGVAFCSIRLLMASTQAIYIIGKQGSLIKSIQEKTGASVRVLSIDETPFYAASDERILELQGEMLKVLKALEAVVGHLRKFLVDHSVLPLFEKNYNRTVSQDHPVEAWPDKSSISHNGLGTDYPLSAKRVSLFLDRETQLESQIQPSGVSLYGQDPALSAMRSSGLGRTGGPIVTQIAQIMQIPFSYAEDIIGIGGNNIAYIRRTSGAIITVEESRGLPDEITVEIKGTSVQVQMAQQLIQEFMSNHKEPISSSYGNMDSRYLPEYMSNHNEPISSSYDEIDTPYRPSYYQLGDTSYPSSSLSMQQYSGGFRSSGVGGYSSFRF